MLLLIVKQLRCEGGLPSILLAEMSAAPESRKLITLSRDSTSQSVCNVVEPGAQCHNDWLHPPSECMCKQLLQEDGSSSTPSSA
eukprot:811534-Pelagomonas_calceolata.AAC.3